MDTTLDEIIIKNSNRIKYIYDKFTKVSWTQK